jgi:tRNA dimethylallyltransferase
MERIVVILGPTAGGKSELAVALARHFGGQIIGADSMQVYRGLDAGTAKPSAELLAAAPHHLIDVVEPTEPWTVADWLGRAERLIAELHAARVLPIVVGGTNLYLKALLEGMFDGPAGDEKFRASLETVDTHALHDRLVAVDPTSGGRIHKNDRKRIVRALEVHHLTGKPISAQHQEWFERASDGATERRSDEGRYKHNPILIGLEWPVELINRRINARVKTMFPALVEETRTLLEQGRLGAQARQALGTKQVLEHLAGAYDLETCIEHVKIETRRFAKAQRTWLKRYRGVHWLAAPEREPADLAAEAIRIVQAELAAGKSS